MTTTTTTTLAIRMESKTEFRARVAQVTGVRYREIPMVSRSQDRTLADDLILAGGGILARRGQVFIVEDCCSSSCPCSGREGECGREGKFYRVHLDCE